MLRTFNNNNKKFLTKIYLLNRFLLFFLLLMQSRNALYSGVTKSWSFYFTYFYYIYILMTLFWKDCLCCKPALPLFPQHSEWQLLLPLAFSMGTHCCCHPLHGKLSFGSWYVVTDQVCDARSMLQPILFYFHPILIVTSSLSTGLSLW